MIEGLIEQLLSWYHQFIMAKGMALQFYVTESREKQMSFYDIN